MPWTIPLNDQAKLCEGEGPISPGAVGVITPELQQKLTEAVEIVPVMLETVEKHLRQALVQKQQNPVQPPPTLRFVREALHKYFCLNPMDGNWDAIVQRIATVYEKVRAGIRNDYSLYVYKVQQGQAHYDANAYVPGSELPKSQDNKAAIGSVVALARFFRVNPDFHWPWDEVQKMAVLGHSSSRIEKREIHLNFDYLVKEESTADVIAKTIIHEATHKWAYTTDVCYKHSTYSVKRDGDTGEVFQTAIRQGFLEKVERAVEREDGKSLVSFAAVNKNTGSLKKGLAYPKSSFQDSNPAWVTNADSYAWAARRLWKLRYQL